MKRDAMDEGLLGMVELKGRIAGAWRDDLENYKDGADSVVVNVIVMVVMAEPLDEVAWTEVEAEEGCRPQA